MIWFEREGELESNVQSALISGVASLNFGPSTTILIAGLTSSSDWASAKSSSSSIDTRASSPLSAEREGITGAGALDNVAFLVGGEGRVAASFLTPNAVTSPDIVLWVYQAGRAFCCLMRREDCRMSMFEGREN